MGHPATAGWPQLLRNTEACYSLRVSKRQRNYRNRKVTDARNVLASQVSEKVFQGQVMRQAKLLGWEAYHTHNSKRSVEGFPDTIFIYPTPEALELAAPGQFEKRLQDLTSFPRVPLVVAELKKVDEYPTPEQRLWLALFRQVTDHVYVWRPTDWEEIHRVLTEARPVPV